MNLSSPDGRGGRSSSPGHASAGDRNFQVLRPGQNVRAANIVAVLRYLLANGPASRSEIASGLGLTQGSVTRITARADEIGLLSTLKPEAVDRGRPRVPIAIARSAGLIASVQIGVLDFVARLLTVTGECIMELIVENRAAKGTEAEQQLVSLATQLCASTAEPILAFTVLSGGWVDSTAGMIRRFAPLGWNGVPARDLLAAELDMPIFVESTARAHAIADLTYGGAATADFVHVFIGNIIEMASVVAGTIVQRDDGFGGDLSNWLVEDADGYARPAHEIVSEISVLRVARSERLIPKNGTFEDLLEIARVGGVGSVRLREILAVRSRAAGRLIGQMALTLAPKTIFVTSGVAAVPNVVEPLGEEMLRVFGDLPAPDLHIDTRGRDSVARAAAAVGVERTLLDRDFVSERLGAVLNVSAARTASNLNGRSAQFQR